MAPILRSRGSRPREKTTVIERPTTSSARLSPDSQTTSNSTEPDKENGQVLDRLLKMKMEVGSTRAIEQTVEESDDANWLRKELAKMKHKKAKNFQRAEKELFSEGNEDEIIPDSADKAETAVATKKARNLQCRPSRLPAYKQKERMELVDAIKKQYHIIGNPDPRKAIDRINAWKWVCAECKRKKHEWIEGKTFEDLRLKWKHLKSDARRRKRNGRESEMDKKVFQIIKSYKSPPRDDIYYTGPVKFKSDAKNANRQKKETDGVKKDKGAAKSAIHQKKDTGGVKKDKNTAKNAIRQKKDTGGEKKDRCAPVDVDRQQEKDIGGGNEADDEGMSGSECSSTGHANPNNVYTDPPAEQLFLLENAQKALNRCANTFDANKDRLFRIALEGLAHTIDEIKREVQDSRKM